MGFAFQHFSDFGFRHFVLLLRRAEQIFSLIQFNRRAIMMLALEAGKELVDHDQTFDSALLPRKKSLKRRGNQRQNLNCQREAHRNRNGCRLSRLIVLVCEVLQTNVLVVGSYALGHPPHGFNGCNGVRVNNSGRQSCMQRPCMAAVFF